MAERSSEVQGETILNGGGGACRVHPCCHDHHAWLKMKRLSHFDWKVLVGHILILHIVLPVGIGLSPGNPWTPFHRLGYRIPGQSHMCLKREHDRSQHPLDSLWNMQELSQQSQLRSKSIVWFEDSLWMKRIARLLSWARSLVGWTHVRQIAGQPPGKQLHERRPCFLVDILLEGRNTVWRTLAGNSQRTEHSLKTETEHMEGRVGHLVVDIVKRN